MNHSTCYASESICMQLFICKKMDGLLFSFLYINYSGGDSHGSSTEPIKFGGSI